MVYNSFIDRISDLAIFRFISVLFLGLSAWMINLRLQNYYANKTCATLATLIILTLPAFGILVAFVGTCATPIGLFLSVAAAVIAARRPSAILLLFASLLIYPPVAMFYWVMAAIEILAFQEGSQKKLTDLFLIGFCALAFYGLTLIATKPYFAGLTTPGYNPYVMNFDIMGKLRWFVEEPLLNALNLWNIFPSRPWAYALITFVLATCALRSLKSYGEFKNGTMDPRQLRERCVLPLLFLSLFFLTSLPGLAATANPAFYRCLTGLTGMVMLTIFWAVNSWAQVFAARSRDAILTVVLGVILVAGVVWANRTLYFYRAKPSMVELRYIKDNLQRIDIDRLKSVHIIRPDSQGLNFRYDEFGTPTTLYNHNILAVVSCLLREINKEKLVIEEIGHDRARNFFIYKFRGKADPARDFQYLIRISESIKNEPVPAADIVIDMNRLYEPGGPLDHLRF